MAIQTKKITAAGANGHHRFTLTVTEESVNTAANTSLVSWEFMISPIGNGWDWNYASTVPVTYTVTVNGAKVSGNIMKYDGVSDAYIAGQSVNIKHDDDGGKLISYSFSVSSLAQSYLPGAASASGTMDLTDIARASQPSLITYPNHTQNVGSFGDTISIHMNRNSSAFTHRVRYAFGSLSGTCIDAETGKAATAVTTGFKWTIPASFMELLPTVTSGSGTIYVDTYNGSTLIGTKYCGFTATVPASVKPGASIQVLDNTGIKDIYGNLVRGLSKLYVKTTGTQAYKSPIKSYAVNANGVRYTAAEIVTGVLTKAGTTTVTATVTDGRGRTSAAASASFDVLDYVVPSVTKLSVVRCNQDGSANKRGAYCKVTFSAAITSLNTKNTAIYYLRYKKTSAAEYTQVTMSEQTGKYAVTNYSHIFAAATGSSYDVEIRAVDRHATGTRSAKCPTAVSILSWRGFKTSSGVEDGVGIGKVPEKANTLQIGYDTEFFGKVAGTIFDAILPVGTMVMRYDHTDPSTVYPGTTWVRVQGAFLWATDSAGTIGQTGGEKEVTLTVDQIPAHTHGSVYSGNVDGTKTHSWIASGGSNMAYGTVSAGGNKAHNNMPPYIQVSVWRRTA